MEPFRVSNIGKYFLLFNFEAIEVRRLLEGGAEREIIQMKFQNFVTK